MTLNRRVILLTATSFLAHLTSTLAEVLAPPVFSTKSTSFSGKIEIKITHSQRDAIIYVTQDGSTPNRKSERFEGSLLLSKTTHLKAIAVSKGPTQSSPVSSAVFLALSDQSQPFQSNLPVIALKSFNHQKPSQNAYQDTLFTLLQAKEDGITDLASPLKQSHHAGIRTRGTSTAKNPKPSLNLELRNASGEDHSAPLLGMPENSDWILRASYDIDRSLIRDALIFKISRKLGHYAPRTRFVELFHDHDDDGLSYPEDYLGIYTLTEKIKRGKSRVRIHRLKHDKIKEPEISGGYLFKDDRPDPGDHGLTIRHIGKYYLVDPKEKEIHPKQLSYLSHYLNSFTMAVRSPSGFHPVYKKHYTEYIDQRSWLVWHWLNTFSGNLDTYKASAYFYKHHQSRNGGRIEAGPLWDFDRSMNSSDPRDDSPFGWGPPQDESSIFSNQLAPWWGWLLSHKEARQAHIDLWHEMRSRVLNWNQLNAMIDGMALELQGGGQKEKQNGSSPAQRNFSKWPETQPRGGSHQAEIQILKDWLKLRLQWIDSQFIQAPRLQRTEIVGEQDGKTSTASLLAPKGASIHYTLDGSDPLYSKTSLVYHSGKPIELSHSLVLKARCRLGLGANSWSAPLRHVHLQNDSSDPPKLLILESDINPILAENEDKFQPHEFEYLAIKNPSSDQTIDLTGAEFTNGIRFSFDQSPIQKLAPGEVLYLAYHEEAFLKRHGAEKSKRLAGSFSPSRLNNSGELIEMKNGLQKLILSSRIPIQRAAPPKETD